MVESCVVPLNQISTGSINRPVQPHSRSRAKMDHQATLFGRECATILPSPPVSPSMYAYSPSHGDHGKYITRLASRHFLPAPSNLATFKSAESVQQPSDTKTSQYQVSPPRNEQTPPHFTNPHQNTAVAEPSSKSPSMRVPQLPSPDEESDHLRKETSLVQRPGRAFSTASYPTPQLVLTEPEHQSDGEELYTGSEEEEDVGGRQEAVKSGAERLAEERKMKRFRSARRLAHSRMVINNLYRLTHAQTRYLMSEFSRQAHPDAAQRERLSRDIPGLNARQVQVWFQNRYNSTELFIPDENTDLPSQAGKAQATDNR